MYLKKVLARLPVIYLRVPQLFYTDIGWFSLQNNLQQNYTITFMGEKAIKKSDWSDSHRFLTLPLTFILICFWNVDCGGIYSGDTFPLLASGEQHNMKIYSEH